jgi:prepilin-type N-terminal cleavage/methylation domain-containing protein/prepilin-type processing-associated H-X9-DG protein
MHRNRKAAFTLIELLVVIAVIAIIAAILFPVFASVRGKSLQAVCLSNLKQIGQALQLYVQDYDEYLPICCSWARAGSPDLVTSTCWQNGITNATSTDTYLGPEQNPPRYVQELLNPYVKNAQIWFCPSVGRNQHWLGLPTYPTYAYNGTTYWWHWYTGWPRSPGDRGTVMISGMAIAAISKPVEAAVLVETPFNSPVKEPCTSLDVRPAHAKGLNVLYADTHAKFNKFSGQVTPNSGFPGNCMENWEYEHDGEGFSE